MFDQFEVIPAIDIEDGEVVQLVSGERGTETKYGDPVILARRWVNAGANTLHIVDLDGAFGGERLNSDSIATIINDVDSDIQLGGGIRNEREALRVLEQGVDRVVLGTAAIQEPEIVERVSKDYPSGVIVSLDAKGGEVLIKGWTERTGLDPIDAAKL
ncbi:MAG: HisA/HisF-related TIM barrel protein, partial [Halobacteriaceae archaeon]